MTQWDSSSVLKPEGTRFKFHWCVRPVFGTQPHFEAPTDPQVEYVNAKWFTSGGWSCLLVSGPRLFLGHSNNPWKKDCEEIMTVFPVRGETPMFWNLRFIMVLAFTNVINTASVTPTVMND